MNEQPRTVSQRLARNTASLFLSQVARIGFNTVLSLLIARRLGSDGLGKYAVLNAYLQIFQILAVTGVPRLVVREMARQRDKHQVWFQHALVNQILGAGGSAILLVFVANALSHPTDTTQALTVAAFSLFPFAISSATESAFQAKEQMGFIALAQVGGRGVQAITSVILLYTGHGIVALAWMIVFGQVLISILEVSIAGWMGLWHDFHIDLKRSTLLFRQSFDFFVLSLSVIIFSKLDVLILSQMVSEEAAGLYSAAFLIIQAVNFLSVSYSDAVYPVLSRLFYEARTRFETLLRKSLLFGMTTTLLIALLLGAVSEPIIGLLYPGKDYAKSVLLLRIQIPFIIVFMWNALLSKGLMVGNLERLSVIVSLVKLGASLIYYLIFTAWLGAVGTSLATVLAGLTGTVLNYYFVNKEFCSLDLVVLVTKPLMVGGILLAVLWMARGMSWPGLMVGGTLFYVSLLFLFRVFSREDVRLLWRMAWPL